LLQKKLHLFMLETDILVHEGHITEDAILEGPGPTMTLLAVQFPFLIIIIWKASSGVQTNINITPRKRK
jgi:hypothetical protein